MKGLSPFSNCITLLSLTVVEILLVLAPILTFETPGSIQEIVCRPFTSINHIKMTVKEEKEMLSKTKRRHGRIRYFNPFWKGRIEYCDAYDIS
ncbi:hypothetical protein E5288_WYG020692 [Bos mutus]|uniref:Uncharacterized protein n=1 Tax=Bos mutus TaxID=72004 RepID=A0A6B0R4H6_9CETA|nr:hypothetical protein [Bos mutus]